ncbi:MAG: hypothetical protein IK039_04595 [Bacteroidaceae bacterium]|nr:hypothetical protein [Bacteroidaceae bacterium]
MSKTKKKKQLSEDEIIKRSQKKDISTALANMGFKRLSGIADRNFTYKERQTDIDDFYVYENIVLLIEYTTASDVSKHLVPKSVFYDLVDRSHADFVSYMLSNPLFVSFKDYYEQGGYTKNQIRIRILYCSLQPVDKKHKKLFENNQTLLFYDYEIAYYFKQLASVIKHSAKYEFFMFLNINHSDIGPIDVSSSSVFQGDILPVEKSSFKSGYNVVSFYIDAESLMRRAYVLRQESWRYSNAGGLYQRMIIGKKINSMRKYLSSEGRVFINNIIATISKGSAKLLDDNGNVIEIDNQGQFVGNESGYDKIKPTRVQIEDKPNVIGIIDGQHRVYAYHEGTDLYEDNIKIIRKKQHLLVTAVLFPESESVFERQKFEATLFKEINNTQSNISSALKQQIELMISPFSSTAISKCILNSLNDNGPLHNHIELHSYDKGKIKTASIVSFGLQPLVKFDDSSESDSFFKIWKNDRKNALKEVDCNDLVLRNEYIEFCSNELIQLFIALEKIVPNGTWHSYNPSTKEGYLSVTFINGFLNLMRCIIKNQKCTLTSDEYYEKMKNLDFEKLKQYKSSQYNKMGHYVYEEYILK